MIKQIDKAIVIAIVMGVIKKAQFKVYNFTFILKTVKVYSGGFWEELISQNGFS